MVALLLFEWRSIVTAAAIVSSLAAAGAILILRDVTLNVMIIAGLVMALGIVIDDAVNDVRQIASRLKGDGEDGTGASRLPGDRSSRRPSPCGAPSSSGPSSLSPWCRDSSSTDKRARSCPPS